MTTNHLDMSKVRKRVRVALAARDLKMRDLTGASEYSSQHISYVFAGKRNIPHGFLPFLEKFLGVPLKWLVDEDESTLLNMYLFSRKQTCRDLFYLAAPYTHSDIKVMKKRVKKINLVAGELMKKGQLIYSPISHCSVIASVAKLPKTWDFWQINDYDMILRCNKLFVLMLPGWKESVGVTAEIKFAEERNIPIVYLRGKIGKVNIDN